MMNFMLKLDKNIFRSKKGEVSAKKSQELGHKKFPLIIGIIEMFVWH